MAKKSLKEQAQQEFKQKHWLIVALVVLILSVIAWSASLRAIRHQNIMLEESYHIKSDNQTQNHDLEVSNSYVTPQGRACGVMIDNHFDAWEAQFGLSAARVVYSTLVEGGTTRFFAVFECDADQETTIGPVRSARPYFLPWALEYDTLYTHVGGSNEALSLIQRYNMADMNEMTSYGPKYFWRDNSVAAAPHNTFTSLQLLQTALMDHPALIKKSAWSAFQVSESDVVLTQIPAVVPMKIKATSVVIDYSQRRTFDAEYYYDAEQEVYYRSRVDEVQFDAETGIEIAIPVLIIQQVPSITVLDEKLRIDMNVVGDGLATYVYQGQAYQGYWSKATHVEPTIFYTSQGQRIAFDVSKLWIEVVPQGYDFTIE